MPEYRDLSPDECRELLQEHRFGRIAVHGRDGIDIFPVNYVWSGDVVAIRTAPGTKLAAAAQNDVAFEIDEVDEAARAGWSVVVKGTGYEVTDSIDEVSEEMRALPVDPWVPGDRSQWLRIEPKDITGRRLQAGQG